MHHDLNPPWRCSQSRFVKQCGLRLDNSGLGTDLPDRFCECHAGWHCLEAFDLPQGCEGHGCAPYLAGQ